MENQSTSKDNTDVEKQTGNVKGRDDNKYEGEGLHYFGKEEETGFEDVCVICLDKWTKRGLHMATRLTCGHIFGYSCIHRWVNMARTCPVCKSINYKHHMRGVYECLGTYYDSSSASAADEARLERRWRDRCRRSAARARRHREARRAANERLRENADATGSQDS